jgi:hypothetical protein
MGEMRGHSAGRETEMRREMDKTRDDWRKVRDVRLALKEKLLSLGVEKREIRRDKKYRALKKEQERLSGVLKRLEKRLNREHSGKEV